ncbi:MAG: NTP transferase domain-containing protein [Muribaculaceae bacterium]|nr:NTP transferase domain-containing protein [Muribaculaceae bacterium]
MEPTVIIQARTGSTRLPDKMTTPFFEGKPVLQILLERLSTLKNDVSQIVVATSANPRDKMIENICNEMGITCFRGSENDVLQRFISAAENVDADKIIRVCADNVFIDLNALKFLANTLRDSDDAYVSFKTRESKPSILTHFGFFAEGVTLDALKRVASMTDEPLYHEHVTNFIYNTPDKFSVKLIPIDNLIPDLENHPDLRLTLDTKDDFDVQQKIYADLDARGSSHSPGELIKYLDSEHPEYYDIMKRTINANKK